MEDVDVLCELLVTITEIENAPIDTTDAWTLEAIRAAKIAAAADVAEGKIRLLRAGAE